MTDLAYFILIVTGGPVGLDMLPCKFQNPPLLIDGFGNGMTPGLIRMRLDEYQDLVEKDGSSIVIALTTTNRTVLDWWGRNRTYDEIYLERDREDPEGDFIPLLEVHTAEWLAQMSLGTIYAQGRLNVLGGPLA